ncbi:TatD family hydrolase [bacterium]|nr:TatD family hydrolase [bacterium]
MSTALLIDSHAHLDGEDFSEDRDAVIDRATAAGVTRIINIGATDGFEGAERSVKLAEQHEGIWCTVGIHPHDAALPSQRERLVELAKHPKVRAIGETGLDFFKEWSPREDQLRWFRLQVEIALEMNLPLVIHSREAGPECLSVLQEMNAAEVGGVFHCYAEDAAFAESLREINFLVSFTGIITFPKATTAHEAARTIPLEQIMIETDAPYLAPVPHRGKRCESAHVALTARRLAELRGISFEEVARQTTTNAEMFYQLSSQD